MTLPNMVRKHRNLWQALAAHWFEDLCGDEALSAPARWLIATAGTATFVVAYMLLTAEVFEAKATILELTLICICISGGLGFLLAWKRKRTGPVRLYISGVALPSFVLLLVKASVFLGNWP